MARSSNPYRGNPGGALSFLGAMGIDTSRIKSAGYAERIAGKLDRQLAEGKEINRQAARGHAVTREHPNRAAPQHREYRAAPTRESRPGPSRTRPVPGGGVIITGHTKASANFVASVAGQMGGNVKISYTGKDGKRHELFSKGGLKPADLKAAMSKAGSFAEGVAILASLIYDEDDDAQPDIDTDYEFYVE